jgi:DNA repair exonuclease SbcCD ATPase subunit
MLGDLTPEALQQEYATRQQEARELDQAARAVSHYNIDTYSIRKDIERLEDESAVGMSWNPGAGDRGIPEDFAAPTTGAGPGGLDAEVRIASRIGGIDMETLIPEVEEAAQRSLSAITGGKYVRIEMGHAGGPTIVRSRDDSVLTYAEQSHGMRDLIYFCLRIGLIEAIAGKQRLPFILDDPLAGFDPARQKAACRVLRTLGTKTQVILFSSNPALKVEGDAAAELK